MHFMGKTFLPQKRFFYMIFCWLKVFAEEFEEVLFSKSISSLNSQ